MKINNINNKYISYNNNSSKPIKHEEPVKSKNYDVIEIGKHKTNDINKSNNLDKIKNNIALEVSKETSSEKLDKIKESIKNNTYQIDVDAIVNKLLDK